MRDESSIRSSSLAEPMSDVAVGKKEERDLLGRSIHEQPLFRHSGDMRGCSPHSRYGAFFLHAVKAATRTVSAAGGVVVATMVGRAR